MVLSEVVVGAVVVRMVATAVVIIGITWSVKLFGPLIGGVLAGLPITLGPAFFFLVTQASPQFVSLTAAHALVSLCATQSFLLGYILLARKAGPWLSITGGIASWVVVAFILHFLPSSISLGLVLFAIVTTTCLAIGKRVLIPVPVRHGKAGWGSLLLRGILAGILVAGVTTTSHWLGSTISGTLLSFPIGYTVIAVTLHQQLGHATVMATLHSAILGTTSLAGFCTALAIAAPHLTPYATLGAALAASFGITLALLAWRSLGGRLSTR